jgi:hypothetical protein
MLERRQFRDPCSEEALGTSSNRVPSPANGALETSTIGENCVLVRGMRYMTLYAKGKCEQVGLGMGNTRDRRCIWTRDELGE